MLQPIICDRAVRRFTNSDAMEMAKLTNQRAWTSPCSGRVKIRCSCSSGARSADSGYGIGAWRDGGLQFGHLIELVRVSRPEPRARAPLSCPGPQKLFDR